MDPTLLRGSCSAFFLARSSSSDRGTFLTVSPQPTPNRSSQPYLTQGLFLCFLFCQQLFLSQGNLLNCLPQKNPLPIKSYSGPPPLLYFASSSSYHRRTFLTASTPPPIDPPPTYLTQGLLLCFLFGQQLFQWQRDLLNCLFLFFFFFLLLLQSIKKMWFFSRYNEMQPQPTLKMLFK